LRGFKVIRTHHQGVLKHDFILHTCPHTKDAVVNTAGLEQGALSHDGISHLGVLQLAGGQIAGTRVDGKFLIIE
jgi:hypothetical protein